MAGSSSLSALWLGSELVPGIEMKGGAMLLGAALILENRKRERE